MNPDGLKIYNKAKAAMLVNSKTVFYAALFLRRPVYFNNPQVPTAAVDEAGNLYINLDFVATLTVQQTLFLLVHEMEHLMGLHPARLRGRDAKAWNKATDAVINDRLRHEGIGVFIEGGVDVQGARESTADALYEQRDSESDSGEGDSGEGIGHDIIMGDASGGEAKPLTPEQRAAMEQTIRNDVAEAAQVARMQGSMSADLKRRIDDILHVSTPWHEILERFMTDRSSTDYSWSRPNRRFLAGGTYLPSLASQNAMGTMVVGIDTSGSVSDKELQAYAGHLNRIMEACVPERVHVVYCDYKVTGHDTFEASDLPLKLTAQGGGGTDMTALFEHVNKTVTDDISALVLLTDGYTPWPNDSQDYPVVVLCTTDIDVEYGDEVVRFDAAA